MVSQIEFTVPGVPVAQPRQRHRIVKGKSGQSFVSNYTPTKDPVNAFKAAVRMCANTVYAGPPLEDALRVDVTFVMPRPKAKVWKTRPMPRYPHTGKPDRDNIDKALMDALTGLMWRDDSQVCDGRIQKVVAAGDEQPHTKITITRLIETT